MTMKTNDEYTGGSTTYYQVDITHPINSEAQPYTAECQDIIDALGMTFNEGNAFKALWRRCAARTLGKSKRGYTDGLYDAEKVVFYGERLVQLEQMQLKADVKRVPDFWVEHDGKGFPPELVGKRVMLRRHNDRESGPHEAKASWATPGNDFWWEKAVSSSYTIAAYRVL